MLWVPRPFGSTASIGGSLYRRFSGPVLQCPLKFEAPQSSIRPQGPPAIVKVVLLHQVRLLGFAMQVHPTARSRSSVPPNAISSATYIFGVSSLAALA